MQSLRSASLLGRLLALVGLAACAGDSAPAISSPGRPPRCMVGDILNCECFDGRIGKAECTNGEPDMCVCTGSSSEGPTSQPEDGEGDQSEGEPPEPEVPDEDEPDDMSVDEPGEDGEGAPPEATGCLAGTSTDYKASGPYQVKTKEVDLGGALGKYTLYYPSQLEARCPHPIVAWGNGSGVSGPSLYAHFHRHAASWGIVVMAAHSGNTASQPFLTSALDYLSKENESAASELEGKLSERAGVAGHGQGGSAATTATTHEKVVAQVNIQGEGVPSAKVALLCETGVKDSGREACTKAYAAAKGPAFLADHQDADRTNTPTTLGARTPAGIEYVRLYTAWWRCFLADDAGACGLFEGGKQAPVCKQSTYATCEGKRFP